MSTWFHISLRTDNPDIFPSLIEDGGDLNFSKLIPIPESLLIDHYPGTYPSIVYFATNRLTTPVEETNLQQMLFDSHEDLHAEELIFQITSQNFSEEELDLIYEDGEQYVQNYEQYGCFTAEEWVFSEQGWGMTEPAWGVFCHPAQLIFNSTDTIPLPVLKALCERYPQDHISFECMRNDGFITDYENRDGCLILLGTRNYADSINWDAEEEEVDEKVEETTYTLGEPVPIETKTYSIGDGFMVDIVILHDNYSSYEGGTYEAFLYHKQYGVKSHMFGVPCYSVSYHGFLNMVEANLPEYLPTYQEDYMAPEDYMD